MNPSKNISEQVHFDHSYNFATMLKICYVTDVFLGTSSRFTEQLFQQTFSNAGEAKASEVLTSGVL